MNSKNNNNNIYNNNNNNVRQEYRRGIPMSKSRRPVHRHQQYSPNNAGKIVKPATASKQSTSAPASYHTVISIDDILRKDAKSLNTLKECLMARGWCKVRYPQKTYDIIKYHMLNIHAWLLECHPNEKVKYSRLLSDGSNKPNPQSEYGYNRIEGFKEGLRILTGDIYNIHYENNKYPSAVKDEILKINKEFDGLAIEIMKSVYDTVYGLTDYKQFGTMYDISILNDGKHQNKALKYSMLDFVNYYNDKQYIDNIRINKYKQDPNHPIPNVLKSEFNVMSHSDPGLFALSFCSSNHGLEMYDHVSKQWIKIGLNEGIWWNGKTSNIINNALKSGEHRIKIDNMSWKPRFTGWYEVSCNKQLQSEIMAETLQMINNDDLNGKTQPNDSMNFSWASPSTFSLHSSAPNNTNKDTMNTKLSSYNNNAELNSGGHHEYVSGISMSKSQPPSGWNFGSAPNMNTQNHNNSIFTSPSNNINNNNTINTKIGHIAMREYMSGIMMSKVQPPSPPSSSFGWHHTSSLDIGGNGVKSKLGATPNAINNINNTNSINTKSRHDAMREYMSGISMSKSQPPSSSFGWHHTSSPHIGGNGVKSKLGVTANAINNNNTNDWNPFNMNNDNYNKSAPNTNINNINDTNTINNNNNHNKSGHSAMREYMSGISMSKSQPPSTAFGWHSTSAPNATINHLNNSTFGAPTNATNNNNNTNNTNNANANTKEYDFGISMSKSGF